MRAEGLGPELTNPAPTRSWGWLCMAEFAVTIDELTKEMNRFVQAMGWYDEGSPAPQTPRNISVSLSLEAAEVLEHFQWGEEYNRDMLAQELADVGLYLLQLAHLTGIDLEQAILDKLEVNYKRVWRRN